ncbi:MAG TPA: hypothetical protein DCZ95_16035 [Verrucomicrobia bacterium]|nr:MAG: hypothetical protein A2X46_06720 [Lentisphaerae bacterium GWF2_57_35]HBA85593.1 hypothetical protein [Verrucomicrobiota bacterium]
MQSSVSVKEWIDMFQEIGLDEAKRKQFHKLFESRHPEGHQGFLEWLGMPAKDIERVRSGSK